MSLSRRFQQLPTPVRWGTYAVALAGLFGLLWLPGWQQRQARQEAAQDPNRSGWYTSPRSNERIRVWVDPETKCHYLLIHNFSVTITPRYDADGASLICNQPVPEGAQ